MHIPFQILWSDVDGSYRGADDNIIYRDTVNRTLYRLFSLWDTYRTAHPLYTITQPKRTQEFVYGMLDMYQANAGVCPYGN